METAQETFADIVNRLLPRNISLAKLSREADIEYSYFHSLMNGRRKDKDAPPDEVGRILRPSPDKGMSTLNALERLGVGISTEDRERMITACLPVPAGYRLISTDRPQANVMSTDEHERVIRLFGVRHYLSKLTPDEYQEVIEEAYLKLHSGDSLPT